jgi:hypothetical protein
MSADAGRVFHPRTAALLAALCGLSLIATILVSALSTHAPAAASAGTDAYSTSAIGYAALVRFLERSGLAVAVSRHASASKARADVPLFVAEPRAIDDENPLRAVADQAQANGASVIVVLPKWSGTPARLRPGWVERASQRPLEDATSVLAELGIANTAGDVERPASVSGASGELAPLGAPELPMPQVLAHGQLEAVLATDQGVVIGRVAGTRTYVVSDPDLFNTHGLGKGANASIALAFIKDHLRATGLVVDEEVHGFGRAPSLFAELLQFPLVLVTLHFAGMLALALWAMMGRFGRPEPAPPRLAPGKLALVDNTAELLGFGGFSAHSLRQYNDQALRDAAASAGIPSDLGRGDLVARLAALSRARGVSVDVEALGRDIDALEPSSNDVRRILTLARLVHRFRKELTRGN